MERNRSIDAFRGITIIGMVFFSLTLKLSKNLPEPLRHNARGMLHLGDLILPMFIFASGLSIAYFIEKIDKLKGEEYYSKIIGRFALLIMVGIGLSYFSANGFLLMDEVMLIAILFIICFLIYKVNWLISIILVFVINSSYLVLLNYGWEEMFFNYYLGGYPATIYYLPIMLIGSLIGKGILSDTLWCKDNVIIFSIVMLFFIITIFLYPIDKLAVTPSFMMFSIIFSIMLFTIVDIAMKKVKNLAPLEYLGRKPLRYWLMMYLFFMIPIILYSKYYEVSLPFDIDWLFGIFLAFGFIAFLAVFSILIDKYLPIKIKELMNF